MSDFDPYLKWLGIRDSHRPPNHYRLLGLELFEDDPEVVAMAADRQMTHVRTFQTGPHGIQSQQLLGELAEARRCLLNAETKRAYDLALQGPQSATSAKPGFQQSDMLPPTAKPIDPANLVPPTPSPPIPPVQPTPAVPPAAILTGSPVVVDSSVEQPTVPIQESFGVSDASSQVRSHGKSQRGRKKSGALGQVLGIVFGGVAAVGVAWLIISSGLLNRIRDGVSSDAGSSNSDTVQIAEKSAESESARPTKPAAKSNDPKQPVTPSKKGDADAPKRNPNRGNRQPANNSTAARSNKASAPWEEARWPQPPESLTRPKSSQDKLLQPVRIAIARRDYEQAKKLWQNVIDDAKKYDPKLDLGKEISETEVFWKRLSQSNRTIMVDEELVFRGKPVKVVAVHPDRVDLRYGNKVKTFSLKTSDLDRDLAIALSLRSNGYTESQVRGFLASDYVHVDLVAGGSSFFDSNLTPSDSKPESPLNDGDSSIAQNMNSPEPPPGEETKDSVPENAAIAKSKKIIRDVYTKGYERNTPLTERIQVAIEMLKDATTTQDSLEKYALLSEAIRIGGECGQTRTVFDAFKVLNENFNIEYWKEADDIFELLSRNLTDATEALRYYDKLIEFSKEAHAAGEISMAIDFATRGTAIAKKGQDQKLLEAATNLRDELRDIDRLITRGKKALEDLKTSPNESVAQLNAGNYFCFVVNDFRTGSRHWLKSASPELIKLAEMELAFETDRGKNKEKLLADAWYDLGKGVKSYRDSQALRRAEYWFEQSLEDSSGLEKSLIETKLKNIRALTKSSTASALVSTIDLEKALFGRVWVFGQGTAGAFTVRFMANGRVFLEDSSGTRTYSWRKVADTYVVDLGRLKNTFSMTNPYELVCTQNEKSTNRTTYSGVGKAQ